MLKFGELNIKKNFFLTNNLPTERFLIELAKIIDLDLV